MESYNKVVLCVDDDPIILNMLMFQFNKSLDPMEYLIEYNSEPSTVLDKLSTYNLSENDELTVILDYQMPKMTGAELAKKIKLSYPKSKCIMLSGQSTESVVEELKGNKVLDYFLPKPWNEKELIGLINNVN